MDNDETLSGILLGDEFLTPMMNSVFDLMKGDLDMQLKLKKSVFIALADHGIRGVRLVRTRKKGFIGKTQELIKRLETIPQSTYRKRGENPPTIVHGILPTPIIEFSNDPVPIDGRVPYQL